MELETFNQDSQVLAKIGELVKQKLSSRRARMIAYFVRQYYANIDEEELLARDTMDLYGAILSHWSFLENRQSGEIKVRVYNPTFAKDGWQSTHTVVEAVMDDMPFLIDTITMELNRLGINMHFIVHADSVRLERDEQGNVTKVLRLDPDKRDQGQAEAPIFIEVDRQPDNLAHLQMVHDALIKVLSDVQLVVEEYQPMRKRLHAVVKELKKNPAKIEQDELNESVEFLKWLDNNHFTFLGYHEMEIVNEKDAQCFKSVDNKGLGILSRKARACSDCLTEEIDVARRAVLSARPLLISKSDHKSSIHRQAYMDVVGVKKYDAKGQVIGQYRFVGLYTSEAYHSSLRYIPFLRHKLKKIVERTGFSGTGFHGKSLTNILENFPRDELFQIDEEELYHAGIGIMQIQERPKIRLFVRKETFGRYYFCMVFVPKDRYNTSLRLRLQKILMRELGGVDSTFKPNFLESILLRIDYTIRIDPNQKAKRINLKAIENKLVVAARNWSDDLRSALVDAYGEHQGSILYCKYGYAFPQGYQETFLPRSAVSDIAHIEKALEHNGLEMSFYRMLEESDNRIRFKLIQRDHGLPLSDVIPILENMGLRVIEEWPYEVTLPDDALAWISDFGMAIENTIVKPADIKEIFQDAFARIWQGSVENDGFNRLIVLAGMPWRDILVLRSYAKYMMQIGLHHSLHYIEDALVEYPAIAGQIVELFKIRHNPELQDTNKQEKTLVKSIHKLLNSVTSLDKDRIFRLFIDVIKATVRCNYFQPDKDGELKTRLSFKLDSAKIPDMPKPVPAYGIFVYASYFEGIHLRGTKVARGGLRWSDRLEDYRTEVLGLMKAQQVKNAVIVPMGAKGGFVTKRTNPAMSRDELMAEGRACYQDFIRSLLDLTDNIKNNAIVKPNKVRCHDGDDPYFVVAADKGTATFSDLANAVAKEFDFWLGDAFASGGSNGYDHKAMGITARGAWESVKRHFLGLGKNIMEQDFTVVGVGDMSGDVFGNGMLYTPHIRLLGAFNHKHIFIDPNPDAANSFKERQRLFNQVGSQWTDYNTKLISAGGGVFSRSAKTIAISPQIQACFHIENDTLTPNQLIQAILTADVELFWNGGIGTYVKSSSENNYEVGDRANDALRVDACDLRCQVIGEGGNLGFTQQGRVEFALQGGLVFTDAIDNSAGVNCSDIEVNIKILLHDIMEKGELTEKQRNALLSRMEGEVSQLVLRENYRQTQVLSNIRANKSSSMDLYIRLIHELEREANLDRDVEFIPSDKALQGRLAADQGLTPPELAVLMAYSKTVIKEALMNSDLAEDPYFRSYLISAFPSALQKKYANDMSNHYLAKQIIITQATNRMMHHMGITFLHRMYDETGATPAMIMRAYVVVKEIFDLPKFWDKIEALDGQIPSFVQRDMMKCIGKLVRRCSRWLLREHRKNLDVNALINVWKPQVQQVTKMLPKLMNNAEKVVKKEAEARYTKYGISQKLASQISDFIFLSPAFDVIDSAEKNQVSLEEMTQIYFQFNSHLSFSWLRETLKQVNSEGYWEMLSGSSLRDDLDNIQRRLSVSVIQTTDKGQKPVERVVQWISQNQFLVNRWGYMMDDCKLSQNQFTKLFAALRSLMDLAESSSQHVS